MQQDPAPRRITLLVVSTMTVMAGATIAPALPEMAIYFRGVPDSEFWVKLVLTLPTLFTAIFAPLAGLIIDRVGRRPLLIGAIILYGLAGSSAYGLDTLPAVLVSRALLGISVAGIMTTAITLIVDYYTGAARDRLMGVQAAFMGFGGVVFLMAGGLMADISWRMPFLIYLSAFGVLPFVLRHLPEPTAEQRAHESDPAGGGFPVRTVVLLYPLAFLSMTIFFAIPVQLPFFLQQIEAVSNAKVGMAIAGFTLFSAVVSLQYRRFKARLSFEAIFMLMYGLMSVGYGLLSISASYVHAFAALIVAGLGMGFMVPNLNLRASQGLPSAIRGRVLGGLALSLFLGQFSSPILTRPIAVRFGLGRTFGLLSAALAALAAVFLLLSARRVRGARGSERPVR